MNVLEIDGLRKVYRGKRGKKVTALKCLDLQITAGEVFGFLGPNGAGKSTTIKTVMGQIRPDKGSVRIFGAHSTDPNSRQRVGYLPENPAFYDFMTARELLQFVGNAFSMSKESIARESEAVLQLLELSDSADRPIRGFSKGMVQRLGLAQVLLHDPDLYVLDEPMSGLDPLGRALVKDIIKDLKQRGKTVFFSTHITSDVEAVCDRVGVLVNGDLMSVDTVDTILCNGIDGYRVHLRKDSNTVEDVFVDKDSLKIFMEQIVSSNAGIERIETQRRDMEAFFLDIVAKGQNATRAREQI
jgi:ABC-2 type transport system ATP-binding protein